MDDSATNSPQNIFSILADFFFNIRHCLYHLVGSNADWKENVKKILTENLINGEQKAIAVWNTQLEYITLKN